MSYLNTDTNVYFQNLPLDCEYEHKIEKKPNFAQVARNFYKTVKTFLNVPFLASFSLFLSFRQTVNSK